MKATRSRHNNDDDNILTLIGSAVLGYLISSFISESRGFADTSKDKDKNKPTTSSQQHSSEISSQHPISPQHPATVQHPVSERPTSSPPPQHPTMTQHPITQSQTQHIPSQPSRITQPLNTKEGEIQPPKSKPTSSPPSPQPPNPTLVRQLQQARQQAEQESKSRQQLEGEQHHEIGQENRVALEQIQRQERHPATDPLQRQLQEERSRTIRQNIANEPMSRTPSPISIPTRNPKIVKAPTPKTDAAVQLLAHQTNADPSA